MQLIKHLRHGNGFEPVTFVRHKERCAYAWGYPKKEFRSIPLADFAASERGVTWHPNFYSAMVAWSEHQRTRKTRETTVGGGDCAKRPPIRRQVRKHRNVQSA